MLPSFKKILFATDLSANSAIAFRYAAGLAKISGAQLHILHVVEPLSNDAKVTMMLYMQNETQYNEAVSARSQTAKDQLEKQQADFWANAPTADAHVADQIDLVEVFESFPAEAILKRAEQLDCDVIVMAAHSQGKSHTFLGNVTKRVIRRSLIPVMVVPSESSS